MVVCEQSIQSDFKTQRKNRTWQLLGSLHRAPKTHTRVPVLSPTSHETMQSSFRFSLEVKVSEPARLQHHRMTRKIILLFFARSYSYTTLSSCSAYVFRRGINPTGFYRASFSAMAASDTSSKHLSSIVDFEDSNWNDMIERTILPLTCQGHKGSSGRVAIVGGSAMYTGAPYYAGMAALKVGSDLATVFCALEASIPIKCYSPELMVLPAYEASTFDALVKNGETETNEAR